jgi:hypothetical protein
MADLPAAVIRVHAQLPITEDELNIDPRNWEWHLCLAFPVDKLEALQFTSKPYKWIRYAIGVVIGARGELSTDRDSVDITPICYDSSLSNESVDLYYRTTDDEKRTMSSFDLNLLERKDRTSNRWTSEKARADFRNNMIHRDELCVLTGFKSDYCNAVHLIPRRMGDQVRNLIYYLKARFISWLHKQVYRNTHPAPWSMDE